MRNRLNKTLLDAVSANGVSEIDLVSDFRHLVLAIDATGLADLTVKVVGSMQETAPDFSSAQSPTNQWDYLETKDLEDGSAIDGDVGIIFSGSADNRQVEVNTNLVRWIGVVVSGYSAGEVTVRLLASTD